jgi:histidyl-tRNA synthetase
MADKQEKMKARLPRGFADRTPEDIRAVDEMVAKIRAVYELYGFEPVETPLVEYRTARTRACSPSRTMTSNG